MNSFQLRAIGTLVCNPELCVGNGKTLACLRLVGHDTIEESDPNPRSRQVTASLWFHAHGAIAAELIAKARKGDQLIIEARVESYDWARDGKRHHGHAFIVTGFRFGAKSGDPDPSMETHLSAPPEAPQSASTLAEVAS